MMRCGVWEKSVLLLCHPFLAEQKSARVVARCPAERLVLADCVSGPFRRLYADLHAQSKGSYLRQSE